MSSWLAAGDNIRSEPSHRPPSPENGNIFGIRPETFGNFRPLLAKRGGWRPFNRDGFPDSRTARQKRPLKYLKNFRQFDANFDLETFAIGVVTEQSQ